MDQVLDILFQCLSGFVSASKALTFSALGFELSLWDFQVALFLISCFMPVFFSLRRADSIVNKFSLSSERNDKGSNDYSNLYKGS